MVSPKENPLILVGEGGSGQACKGPSKNERPADQPGNSVRANYDLEYDARVAEATWKFMKVRLSD